MLSKTSKIIFVVIIFVSILTLIIIIFPIISSQSYEKSHDNEYSPSISYDGRYIAFQSNSLWLKYHSKNLQHVLNSIKERSFDMHRNYENYDAYIYDDRKKDIDCISIASSGEQSKGGGGSPIISNDGRYVHFYGSSDVLKTVSNSKKLSDGGFIRDMRSNRTIEVDPNRHNFEHNGLASALMSKGSYDIILTSDESRFIHHPIFPLAEPYTFICNIDGNKFEFVQGFAHAISDNGRYVLLKTNEHIIQHIETQIPQFYLFDRKLHIYSLVSKSTTGIRGNDNSNDNDEWSKTRAAVNGDGHFVTFSSKATNLVPNISRPQLNVYLHDCITGNTSCISQTAKGQQSNGESGNGFCAMSMDGRYITFDSTATNIGSKVLPPGRYMYRYDRLSGKTTCVNDDVHRWYDLQKDDDGEMAMSGNGQVIAFRYNNKLYIKNLLTNSIKIITSHSLP